MWKWIKKILFLFFFVGVLVNLLRPFREYLLPWVFLLKYIALSIGALLFAIVCFAAYRIAKVRAGHRKRDARRRERIAPLLQAIDAGRSLRPEEILPYARNIATRWDTFDLLRMEGLTDLFPEEFNTVQLAAEGKLVAWLEAPNELGAIPDEIEHAEDVTIEENGATVFYSVFKFRVFEPHWAAQNGWMFGVVGPYSADSEPYDWPDVTFSPRRSGTVS